MPFCSIALLFLNPVSVKTSCARRSPDSGSLDLTNAENLARRALVDSGKVGVSHCVLSVAILGDAGGGLRGY